jgi:hypothetical protein
MHDGAAPSECPGHAGLPGSVPQLAEGQQPRGADRSALLFCGLCCCVSRILQRLILEHGQAKHRARSHEIRQFSFICSVSLCHLLVGFVAGGYADRCIV